MKIKPLPGRIMVKQLKPETVVGGIIIPERGQQEVQRGHVVELGEEVKEVQIGDLVIFDQVPYTKVAVDGEEFGILNEMDALAYIREEKKDAKK